MAGIYKKYVQITKIANRTFLLQIILIIHDSHECEKQLYHCTVHLICLISAFEQ